MLQARDLGARIGERWLWRGIGLDLTSGSRVGVRGSSGSGKSFLLRCLAGLAEPVEGEIRFRSDPLKRWFMPSYRAQVMYLPADPLVLPGSVETNLRAPFALESHAGRVYQRQQIIGWLESLSRDESFLQRSSENLSSGERQILALLRALQLQPSILLLDEATASLDPDSEAGAEQLLLDWIDARPGRAWVAVSHAAAQLQRLCSEQLEIAGR